MKKTSVYILSIIVIAVLACSVLMPAYKILSTATESFLLGFNEGMNLPEGAELPETGTSVELEFHPEISTMLAPTDSISISSGVKSPIVYQRADILVPDRTVAGWYPWIVGFCYPLEIILLIVLIWKFLKFVINISKGRIFENVNVKLLRQFSIIILSMAFLEICAGIASDALVGSYHFALEGYKISASWNFPWSNLLLGCVGLMISQIWAIGIQIKEDQELTI